MLRRAGRRLAASCRRCGEPMEPKKDADPALLANSRDVGRDARRVDGKVHDLAGAEEDPLPEAVVGAPRCGEVERQVCDRRVLGGDTAADDAVDTDVGGEVTVRALEQFEAEVQLGLGDSLAEVVVDSIGHAAAPPGRQSVRRPSRGPRRVAIVAVASGQCWCRRLSSPAHRKGSPCRRSGSWWSRTNGGSAIR